MTSIRVGMMCALFLAPTLCCSQSCEPRFEFNFADGGKRCLSDMPFADEPIIGWSSSVRRLVPGHGLYSIAMPPRNGHCPVVVAMSFTRDGPNTNNGYSSAQTPVRSATALKDCQKSVDEAKPVAQDCACTLIIENAASPLGQAAFDAYVGRAADRPK